MIDFGELTTALLADACVRAGVPLRVTPAGLRAVAGPGRLAGRVRAVRHYGSVDVFLEAYEQAHDEAREQAHDEAREQAHDEAREQAHDEARDEADGQADEHAQAGDVLVIDNGGRTDEACIGDLTVLEARAAGVAGLIVWGLHRDTAELIEIGHPVFSYGALPAGPTRVDPRAADAAVRFGEHVVSGADLVLADGDGAVFIPADRAAELIELATAIHATEREQARRIAAGETLREQTRFAEYLGRRREDPQYTFRMHLRRIGGAIEE